MRTPIRCALLNYRSALRDGTEARDRGSGAGAVILFALVFLALAAFVVDGGMSISQRERAADIAEQAARYAAMDIDLEALREGEEAPINYENCGQRVADYANQAGLTGADVAASGCTTATADLVEVRIRVTYRPVLTGMFYTGPIEVHGTAAAENQTG